MAGRMNVSVIVFFDPVSGKLSLGDGRSRLDALDAVGITLNIQIADDTKKVIIAAEGIEIPEPQIITIADGFDPYAFVASTNVARRHLNTAEKREIGAKLITARPELTDHAIAKLASIDHKTVATIRKEILANGETPHNAKRVEKTGRKARGRKPGRASAGKEASIAASVTKDVAVKVESTATAGEDPAASAEARKAEYAAQEVAEYDDRRADGTKPDAKRKEPTGEDVAAAFGRLSSIGISKFLGSIPIGHHHNLEHALGVAANAEIAKLAREASALLTHAEHNKDDIYKRLARIMSLADPDKKFCATKLAASGNAPRNKAPTGADDLGIPDFLRRERPERVH
jgi:hypothetical protein